MLSLRSTVLTNKSAWEIFQDKHGDQVTENVLLPPTICLHAHERILSMLSGTYMEVIKIFCDCAGSSTWANSEGKQPGQFPKTIAEIDTQVGRGEVREGEKHRMMGGEGSEFSFDFAEMIFDLLICQARVRSPS